MSKLGMTKLRLEFPNPNFVIPGFDVPGFVMPPSITFHFLVKFVTLFVHIVASCSMVNKEEYVKILQSTHVCS